MVKYLLSIYKKATIGRPECCRFYPSCSEYMAGAVEKHGPARGLILGVLRLLKCNQLFRGGYDPLP